MAESIRFQHFEVLRRDDGSLWELGRGAMGVTYKAFDTNLRNDVALKVISPAYLNSEIARERFLREARAAAAIRHPNVASVFHLGNADDVWFYAMEFVDGETVEQAMRRDGAVPLRSALDITDQVARALGAAEKRGLVHRDIKPANLMLTHENSGEITVKVIDFGLAKPIGGDGSVDVATLTAGGFLGTPHFASPEQLEERDLDTRSDIYSLGVTLYYMLAGQTPFSGSLAQVMSQHLHREPPLERLTGLPVAVVELLKGMLAKDVAERFQSAADLRKAIAACVERVGAADAIGAPAGVVVAGDHDTMMETAVGGDAPASEAGPKPDDVLAGRFLLHEEFPSGQFGRTFRATNQETGEIVAVLILDAAVLPTRDAYTRLEDEITALQRVRHPAVIRVDSVEHTSNYTFITREWSDAPSLLEFLRTSPPSLAENLSLLASLADGLDTVQTTGVPCPEMLPAWIAVISSQSGSLPQAKFNPINLTRVPPSALGAGRAGNNLADRNVDRGAAFAAAVARVAITVFGGAITGSASGGFVAIPALAEEANEILRSATDGSGGFQSAGEFMKQFAASLNSGSRVIPDPEHLLSDVPDSIDPPHRSGGLVLAILVAFLLLGGLAAAVWIVVLPAYLDRNQIPSAVRAETAGVAEVASEPEPPSSSAEDHANASDPSAVDSPSPSASSVPVETPVDELASNPDPTPENTPMVDSVADGLSRAAAFAAEEDYALAFDVLSDLQQLEPDDDRILPAQENVAAKLRAESPILEGERLTALRDVLEDAALNGAVSAQMVLAQSLEKSEPAEAFKLYLVAAEAGNSEAMLKTGDFYAAGIGTDVSFEKAFPWFERAAHRGEPRALFSVGECYYFGAGVTQDFQKAIYYLTQGAAYNDPYAKGLLGTMYRKGEGMEKPNVREAYRLLSEAKEQGFLDAQGNLGVMIIMGEVIHGKPVDPPRPDDADQKKAFALFEDGAKQGNPMCTFLYARCLELGAGIPKRDPDLAKEQYIKAAELGNESARQKCKEMGWSFEASPSADVFPGAPE